MIVIAIVFADVLQHQGHLVRQGGGGDLVRERHRSAVPRLRGVLEHTQPGEGREDQRTAGVPARL